MLMCSMKESSPEIEEEQAENNCVACFAIHPFCVMSLNLFSVTPYKDGLIIF